MSEQFGGGEDFYVASLSCRTICYKGMFMAWQLFAYYPDLEDERIKSALAIVHQRYSTNTFPNWRLAHPFRCIAHNGEINTLSGNRNPCGAASRRWSAPSSATTSRTCFRSRARRQRLGLLRQCLELLVMAGRSMPHCDDDADPRGLWAQVPYQHG